MGFNRHRPGSGYQHSQDANAREGVGNPGASFAYPTMDELAVGGWVEGVTAQSRSAGVVADLCGTLSTGLHDVPGRTLTRVGDEGSRGNWRLADMKENERRLPKVRPGSRRVKMTMALGNQTRDRLITMASVTQVSISELVDTCVREAYEAIIAGKGRPERRPLAKRPPGRPAMVRWDATDGWACNKCGEVFGYNKEAAARDHARACTAPKACSECGGRTHQVGSQVFVCWTCKTAQGLGAKS